MKDRFHTYVPNRLDWRLWAETIATGVLTIALAYAVFFFIWIVL